MGCVALRLEANGLETLDLAGGAVAAATLDLGFPVVREDAIMAPDTDGSIDSTSLSGPRSVALEVLVNEHLDEAGRWALVQHLKSFLNPRLRPSLYVQYPGGVELVATLRAAGFSDAWTPELLRTGRSTVFAQWIAPSGILESATEVDFEVTAASVGADGLDWPVDWPVDWGTSTTAGVVEVTNDGDRDAFPLLQLHGPWSGETLVENITTGKALVFDGESVLVDNYIEIDTRAKTVELVDTTGARDNRYNRLIFPDSDWWTVVPGVNVLRFSPAVSSSPARMAGRFRSAYS